MATYVLVHGGGHGGWCYQPVARIMRGKGQEVYTPTLTGLGERQHLLSPAVADRATDRVGHLVFLDAATPRNGQSLVDVAGPVILAARKGGRMVDGMELVLYPGEDPMRFYGVTDPEQIAWMKPKLTPHPWKCFEQKLMLENEAEMRKILQTHIVCTSTLAFRDLPALREASKGRVWDIDTGHDLMISEPQVVADMLLRLALL
jgi:hypothetical protein